MGSMYRGIDHVGGTMAADDACRRVSTTVADGPGLFQDRLLLVVALRLMGFCGGRMCDECVFQGAGREQ